MKIYVLDSMNIHLPNPSFFVPPLRLTAVSLVSVFFSTRVLPIAACAEAVADLNP